MNPRAESSPRNDPTARRAGHEPLKPRLLVIELWGVGDLALATPFLRAACERFSVTLLAKPHAAELQSRFWPDARVIPFTAPWTAFRGKYKLWEWPWREMRALRRQLAVEQFHFAVSARLDPRDHLLMATTGAERRIGFPRVGSAMFLTDPLDQPRDSVHRYDFWRCAASVVGIELPPREKLLLPPAPTGKQILVHSGARLPARLWPLERYQIIVQHLRETGCIVQVACDTGQESWWRQHGETAVAAPRTLAELFGCIDAARLFIGNDSGPGHLAAISGVPTFTIFGPQQAGIMLPLHPQAEFLEDNSCEFKPCADYCHFDAPKCLLNISEAALWARVQEFIARHPAD
jgi:heptosyltransferase-2